MRTTTKTTTVHREVLGLPDRSERKDRTGLLIALRNKVKEEEH